MTEQECLERMVAPGTPRKGKFRSGVIQIHVTRSCNLSCFSCTQGSNLGGRSTFMSPEQFAQAVESLRGYFGVVGVFGGNPAVSPFFQEYCAVLRKSWVPREQRGLWCNHPITLDNARAMRETFSPAVSNLNVHMDAEAHTMFKQGWPEALPFGLVQDSRHSPPFVAMRDVLKAPCRECDGDGAVAVDDGANEIAAGLEPRERKCQVCGGSGQVYDEARAWELISGCDINQHWSAMIGVFRGQLRAWFCEIAGAQSILHQDEPDYPDTGLDPTQKFNRTHTGDGLAWWELKMNWYADQVRKHCHDCGVPLRGYGSLAQAEDREGTEQCSRTHAGVHKLKRRDRVLQVVTELEQLGTERLERMTNYMQNARK